MSTKQEVTTSFIWELDIFFKMKLDTKGRDSKNSTFNARWLALGNVKIFDLNCLGISIRDNSDSGSSARLELLITAEDKINPKKRYIQIISGNKRVELRLGKSQIESITNALQNFLSKVQLDKSST